MTTKKNFLRKWRNSFVTKQKQQQVKNKLTMGYKMKILSFLFALLLVSCTDYQDAWIEHLEVHNKKTTQIWYGDADEQNMIVDLPSNQDAKVILMVYGSGWQGGGIPESLVKAKDSLKKAMPNYAYVMLNYRGGTFPNPARIVQLQDINLAVNYLKSHASSLGIKPEFVLLGTSSGAHISSVFTYSKMKKSLSAVNDVKGLVLLYPPLKFPSNITPFQAQIMGNLLGEIVNNETINKYRYLEPYSNLNKRTVPQYIVAGKSDDLVPIEGVRDYATKLQSLNIEYTLQEVPTDHSGEGIPAELEQQINTEIINFIKRKL